MHSKEKLLSNSAVSKTTIELFKELPVSEQECVVSAFIRYIYKADRHNAYVDVENDYNKIAGEFRSYFKEFRLWVGSYMLAKENSIDSFLLCSVNLLNDESMVSSEIPVGVTIDQRGRKYLLRYINGIGVRSTDLNKLKSEWNLGLKKAVEVE